VDGDGRRVRPDVYLDGERRLGRWSRCDLLGCLPLLDVRDTSAHGVELDQ
jgi:hypothetical protein